MKKNTALQVLFIVFVGLLPLLWYHPGTIIANGDNFPLFNNPQQVFQNGLQLWSPNALGYTDSSASYAIYQYPAAALSSFGLGVGAVQILLQVFFFMGAGLSMFYLSKTVYPDLKISALAASFFYMFNFFVLLSRSNVGFTWVYTFLPLLLALAIKTVNYTYQGDRKAANKNIVYFAVLSTVTFSFASINPANIALISLAIVIVTAYFVVKYRRQLKPLALAIGKTLLVAVPINLWWLLPMLNAYVFSPQALNSQLNVAGWTWTHVRASLLNLFWLNGNWNWTPEYYPYYNAYLNPVLVIAVFAPFILAACALLFKSGKNRFNAYLMVSVLALMFLAKGVHEPLSQLNMALYQIIPYMDMFREPAPKFMMLIVIFLALLIGFSVDSIANLRLLRVRRLLKVAVPAVLLLVFVVATFPLVTGPIESWTYGLPFSSYVQVPDYWHDAANFLNSQKGDFRVLLAPLDDFYQMPYSWSYYGTDQLVETLIDKPIVSTNYLEGYTVNQNTAATLNGLNASIQTGNSNQFQAYLDLLSIKYIVLRNDLAASFNGREIMSPAQLETFFQGLPYLKLDQSMGGGNLLIYEYTQAKPMYYAVPLNLAVQSQNFSVTDIDSLILSNPQLTSDSILNTKTLSSTKIQVTVNASQPFILATSQTLDNAWVATVNGQKIPPSQLYFGLSGFAIDQLGQYTVTLEYTPQTSFYYVSYVSIITLVLCLVFLVWMKHKK